MSTLDQFKDINHLFNTPDWMQSINKYSELLAPRYKLESAAATALAEFQRNNDMALKASALAAFSDSEMLRASQLAAARLTAVSSISEAMKKAAFNMNAFKDISSYGESIRAAQLATAGLNGTVKSTLDAATSGSIANILKSVERFSDSSLLKSISHVPDSLRKMTEAFSGSQHLQNLTVTTGLSGQAYQDMIRAYGMDTLADRFASFDWPDNVTLNDDDSITVDEHTIGSIEVSQAISQVVDAVTQQHPQKIEEQLNKIFEQLEKNHQQTDEQAKKQPNPYMVALWIPLILMLLAPIYNAIIEKRVQNLLGDATQVQKTLPDQTISLDTIRLVKRKELAVRKKASPNARSIGKLHADQVVVLLEERDNWALVYWSDKDNGLSIQGWVLGKYLQKPR